MTKSIAEQKAELLKKLAELEELEKNEWPKIGDRYFIYCGDDDIVTAEYENDFVDQMNKLEGNFHRTEAEALAWGAKRDKLLRVTARLKELQGGWVPDWQCEKQHKFEPYYDWGMMDWCISATIICHCWFATPPFQTREALQAALDELGDDMNVFLEV